MRCCDARGEAGARSTTTDASFPSKGSAMVSKTESARGRATAIQAERPHATTAATARWLKPQYGGSGERSGGTQPKGPGKALRATVRATATARLAADVRALAAIIKHQQLVTDFRENTIRLHLNSHPFAHDNEMRYRTDVLFYCIISTLPLWRFGECRSFCRRSFRGYAVVPLPQKRIHDALHTRARRVSCWTAAPD